MNHELVLIGKTPAEANIASISFGPPESTRRPAYKTAVVAGKAAGLSFVPPSRCCIRSVRTLGLQPPAFIRKSCRREVPEDWVRVSTAGGGIWNVGASQTVAAGSNPPNKSPQTGLRPHLDFTCNLCNYMIKHNLMKRRVEFATVILLLLSVLTVVILPSVDLQPTALRAARLASLVYAVLVLAGAAMAARTTRPIARIAAIFERVYVQLPAPDLIDLNCTRLC